MPAVESQCVGSRCASRRARCFWRQREGRKAQPPRDDAIDMLEQQHFGEQILILLLACSSRTASSPIWSSSERGTVFLLLLEAAAG